MKQFTVFVQKKCGLNKNDYQRTNQQGLLWFCSLQRTVNEWNKLSMDCISASRVNMFKNRLDTSQEGGLHVDEH